MMRHWRQLTPIHQRTYSTMQAEPETHHQDHVTDEGEEQSPPRHPKTTTTDPNWTHIISKKKTTKSPTKPITSGAFAPNKGEPQINPKSKVSDKRINTHKRRPKPRTPHQRHHCATPERHQHQPTRSPALIPWTAHRQPNPEPFQHPETETEPQGWQPHTIDTHRATTTGL
jgi:hypothetical protein